MLVCGVVLFVLPTLEENHDRDDDDNDTKIRDVLAGCAAELLVVTISGFAAIYFEVAIKQRGSGDGGGDADDFAGTNIWGRNFQLGFYSVIMYLLFRGLEGTATHDDDDATDGEEQKGARGSGLPPSPFFRPFFVDWSPLAVILSISAACGGLLVALSIKYGDSVLKTLAVSGSILFASVVDHYLLGGPLTGQMGVAAVVTIIAIVNYAFDESSSTTTSAADSYGTRLQDQNTHSPAGDATTGDADGEEEWEENEPIEMRPVVHDGEGANRRSHISA